MKLYKSYFLIIILAVISLSACTTPPKPSSATLNAVDNTMGGYNKNQARQLILLTMNNASHEQLSEGLLITKNTDLPPAYNQFLKSLSLKYNLKWVADWPLSTLGIRCFVFKPSTELTPEILEKIENEAKVETVQYLQIFNTVTSSYNDPLVELQKDFSTMSIEPSHRWTTGKGVKIAVIDTGADDTHNDLKNRIRFVQNFVDKNKLSFQQDIHGTAIAGVIASNANNNEGLVGIAPDADIYALKSCWYEQDNTDQAYCNSFTLAKALNKAISKDVDLINLSLAGPPDDLLQRLVEKAIQRNIIVIGATHPELEPSFPTSIPGVIAVSQRSSNQTRTITTKQLTIASDNVISTRPDDKYDYYSGSSISTAQVTGIIALIRQRRPHLSHHNVRELLYNNQSNNQSINACTIIANLVGAKECI